MKQLVHRLRDGQMRVVDVAPPALGPGRVLVRNHYSLISSGTERSTVDAARKGLVGKAMERPDQVRKVVETIRQQGPVPAYRAVRKRLDALSPLGYSAAGEVVEVAPDVHAFRRGDLVACGGAGHANHAELIAVPAMLCVALSRDADLARAAYNTVGAIALQGIRQADVRLGEACAVIGLGLVGQLTALMLRAAGVRVVGLDIDPRVVEAARVNAGLELALVSGDPETQPACDRMTGGVGLDAVIITAATRSLEPINLAGRLLRKRGAVVIVGDVPTGFDREPDFYRKELTVRMSCSYGPGRYDPDYEERGRDYPAAYVRWTENRNMQAFQDLVGASRIDLDYLTTHRFALDRAPEAYDLLLRGGEPHLGVLIEYDTGRMPAAGRVDIRSVARTGHRGTLGVSFIGAGSYAQSHLLPAVAGTREVELRGVLTASGTGSRTVAERCGFAFCAAQAAEILDDPETHAVFVATRHDSHAGYVRDALRAGKHVFVEKPLCLDHEELTEIERCVSECSESTPLLMVGFNRRFAPLAEGMKGLCGAEPVSVLYRVNAGAIPADSWIQDREVGGGRVVGEICHFIDFVTFLTGARPIEVHAAGLEDPFALHDTLTLTLRYGDGSLGTIAYGANGSPALGKERIELHASGRSAVIEDFKRLMVHGGPGGRRTLNADKGQPAMVAAFLDAVRRGGPAPIPFADLRDTTLATFAALNSLRTGRPEPVDPAGD